MFIERNRFLSGVISFDFSSRHNRLRVQQHGADMDKLESHTSKEAAWHSRLLRHAQSGKTIAAFCRDESVSTASFHIWRSKLAAASEHAAQLDQRAAFIDSGTIVSTADVTPLAHSPASAPVAAAGTDVRIDLGGGIVLTITRRRCSSLKAKSGYSCTGSRSTCACRSMASTRWRKRHASESAIWKPVRVSQSSCHPDPRLVL